MHDAHGPRRDVQLGAHHRRIHRPGLGLTPQQRTHPRTDLLGPERRHDDGIGPHLQRQHPVHRIARCDEANDVGLPDIAQHPPEGLVEIDVRAHVHQHDVVGLAHGEGLGMARHVAGHAQPAQ